MGLGRLTARLASAFDGFVLQPGMGKEEDLTERSVS